MTLMGPTSVALWGWADVSMVHKKGMNGTQNSGKSVQQRQDSSKGAFLSVFLFLFKKNSFIFILCVCICVSCIYVYYMQASAYEGQKKNM